MWHWTGAEQEVHSGLFSLSGAAKKDIMRVVGLNENSSDASLAAKQWD